MLDGEAAWIDGHWTGQRVTVLRARHPRASSARREAPKTEVTGALARFLR